MLLYKKLLPVTFGTTFVYSKEVQHAQQLEISTHKLFYKISMLNCRGKTDSKFVKYVGFLCDEALS